MRCLLFTQVQYIQTQGAKIGLSIAVNAPQIRIPCNSKSQEMLVADLGQLHISNSIKSSSQYGLIDTMDVSLSSFQVSGYAQPSYAIQLSSHTLSFPDHFMVRI